jgi:hypothetical protein
MPPFAPVIRTVLPSSVVPSFIPSLLGRFFGVDLPVERSERRFDQLAQRVPVLSRTPHCSSGNFGVAHTEARPSVERHRVTTLMSRRRSASQSHTGTIRAPTA